jgi:hypothetical protein
VNDKLQPIGEKRLQHPAYQFDFCIGCGLGDDVEADLPRFDPVGARNLLLCDDPVCELQTFTERDIRERECPVAEGPQVDGDRRTERNRGRRLDGRSFEFGSLGRRDADGCHDQRRHKQYLHARLDTVLIK